MCVAIVKPAGVEVPSESDLRKAYAKNPHGAGFMVPTSSGKGVSIFKGFFTFESFYKSMKAHVTVAKPAVLHFRIATHGTVTGGLSHPFPIVGSFETMRKTTQIVQGPALAHNGILPCGNGGNKDVSDTMVFAKLLAETGLHEKAKKDNAFSQSILMMTKGSKIVVMWPSGQTRLFGDWQKVKGVFWSNLYWQNVEQTWLKTFGEPEEDDGSVEGSNGGKVYASTSKAEPQKRVRLSKYVSYLSASDKETVKESKRCPKCNDRLLRGTDGSLGCVCGFTM